MILVVNFLTDRKQINKKGTHQSKNNRIPPQSLKYCDKWKIGNPQMNNAKSTFTNVYPLEIIVLKYICYNEEANIYKKFL